MIELTPLQISQILQEYEITKNTPFRESGGDHCEFSDHLDLLTVIIAVKLLEIKARFNDDEISIINPFFIQELNIFKATKIVGNFNRTGFYNVGEVSVTMEEVLKIQEIITQK
jgi:hypothetical protein